mmetsp:Transcript_154496/g.494170  ORF Transcript_154496/g.494170 Transcript_154496/m.494170 type:complete len:514 (-) Transcript_154496:63-1604(-)
MSDAAQGEGMSKSAKKRASKKVRDEAHEEEAPAAPTPVPPPPPKAKAKAASAPEPQQSQPKAKGKAKAAPAEPPNAEPKAEPKAKAKAEPEPPAPAPKAKGKAKAAPAPAAAPAPEPPAPEPKAKAKAASKQKAKPAAKPVEEEEKPKEVEKEAVNFVIDDGSGGSWETSTGLSKQAEKRKQKQNEAKQFVGSNGRPAPMNVIPGMAPLGAQANTAAKGKGASQSVSADVERILAMKNPASEEKAKEPEGNSSSVTIHVPENKIGIIIGPKGSKIKLLQEKCEVDRIDTAGSVFTIIGKPANVAKAEAAIKELIEKGYCSMMFEGFSENIMNVYPSAFPDLIGKQGAVVRKIKEELNVEINFQDVPKGSPPSKKAKVTLAGSAADVEKAKTVINNILMYCHDELTHPGQVHEELDIEPWAYRYIIGRAGSEMKHIQANWKVRVNIPRENSANDKVLIVGEAEPVSKAKAYVDKLIWNAENNAKGRDKADTAIADPWGDEEPVEEWMKGYMYKR